jgi:hypothetical protein
MHQSGDESLKQLPLSEHDHRFVAQALGKVVDAVCGGAQADEPEEQERAACEQGAGDSDCCGERQGAGEPLYPALDFLISAVIAGTISCRSPMTA